MRRAYRVDEAIWQPRGIVSGPFWPPPSGRAAGLGVTNLPKRCPPTTIPSSARSPAATPGRSGARPLDHRRRVRLQPVRRLGQRRPGPDAAHARDGQGLRGQRCLDNAWENIEGGVKYLKRPSRKPIRAGSTSSWPRTTPAGPPWRNTTASRPMPKRRTYVAKVTRMRTSLRPRRPELRKTTITSYPGEEGSSDRRIAPPPAGSGDPPNPR